MALYCRPFLASIHGYFPSWFYTLDFSDVESDSSIQAGSVVRLSSNRSSPIFSPVFEFRIFPTSGSGLWFLETPPGRMLFYKLASKAFTPKTFCADLLSFRNSFPEMTIFRSSVLPSRESYVLARLPRCFRRFSACIFFLSVLPSYLLFLLFRNAASRFFFTSSRTSS